MRVAAQPRFSHQVVELRDSAQTTKPTSWKGVEEEASQLKDALLLGTMPPILSKVRRVKIGVEGLCGGRGEG